MRWTLLISAGFALAVLAILVVVRGGPDGGHRPSDVSDAGSVPTASRDTGVSQSTLQEGNLGAAPSSDHVATASASEDTVVQPASPPVMDPTTVRDVSVLDLFAVPTGRNVAPYVIEGPAPTVEEILAEGLRLAGASPVHIAVRGTPSASSVRCDWRGIARTTEQRERAIRFWLGLEADAETPDAAFLEALFTATMDVLDPANRETAKSNFLAIARGGLSTEYLFLTCYADYAVSEYLLGSGASTLTVAYDRMGEAHSYELYMREYDTGLFGEKPPMPRGDYESQLLNIVMEAERSLRERIGDYESVLFLAPMGAHNAIAVEAWQAVAQWDVQVGGDGTLNAVRYGTPEYDPEHTQTLASLSGRIATATTATSTATSTLPVRIADTGGLEQYYREMGAYGDITPGDGSAATFTPSQPPAMPTCAGAPASSGTGSGPGLIRDCTVLLESMAALAGTASLDWNASTTISSWEGVTLNASSTRVTGLDLNDEDLDGTIPAALGELTGLETLDLSDNGLSGAIPSDLGMLWDLRELRLSGNSLTGCIPLELRSVPVNDLGSLGLPYCEPPAPENLTAGVAGESSITLSWDAVAGAGTYRVEYRAATSTEWVVDAGSITVTSHTVDELMCGIEYEFRVRSYGGGLSYEAVWGLPSGALSSSTVACNRAPEFATSTYAFRVAENVRTGHLVGTVSATDPDEGDALRYEILSGNQGDAFAVGEISGRIAVAGELDHETAPSYSLTVEVGDDRGGTATTTAEIIVTNVIELPGVPQSLRATVTAGSVTLEWDAPDDGAVTGYQVLRRQPSIHPVGEFHVIEEDTGGTETVYVDGSVEPRTQYVYRVKAVNPEGMSSQSGYVSVVSGAAVVPAPGGLSVSLSDESFTITWEAVAGAARYEVQYRTGAEDDEDDWESTATTTEVSVMISPEGGPACGTDHEFRVRAYGDGTTYAAAWGDPSGAESVTTDRCNVAPEFTESTYEFVLLEGSAAETMVGTVTATDLDDDTVTYEITSGNGAGVFAIATSTGEITLVAALGSAVGTEYSLMVEASDGYGGSASVGVTVTVAASGCSGGIAVADPGDNAGLVSDCETLLGLKDALAGTATLNWNGATAITSWDGVTVGGSPQRVTELSLRGRGLTGVIPAGLGDLSGLQVLDLSANQLTGGIPAELGGLSNLNTLWLHQNRLTGGIPAELGNLSNLIWMAVSGNGLTGEIPSELGGLPDLSQLLVQRNRLSGELPRELGDLTSLIVLQMSDNLLSGPIPPELSSLSGLSVLNLSRNPLEGCIPPSWRGISSNDFAALGLPYCGQSGRVPTPQGVSASVSGVTFTVGWSAVSGAGLYEVQQRIGGSVDEWVGAATSTSVSLSYIPEGGPACETSYEIRVRAYGDGTTYAGGWGAASATGTVTTGECSQPPEFGEPLGYSFTVSEDAATSTLVGTVSASDPDEGDVVAYSITTGNEADRFTIGKDTGEITVAGALDYETALSYSLTVSAGDGSRAGTATTTVEIAVTDVPEDAPAAPGGVSVSLSEGIFTIGWEPVAGAGLYEAQYLIEGDGSDWAGVGTTTATLLTYSPKDGPACGSTYGFRVLSYGDGVSYASVWGEASDAEIVTTDPCNRAPAFDEPFYSFSVPENATTTDPVGMVSATDPDEGDVVRYTITAGNEGGAFAMGEGAGEITVASALDHATTPSYRLTVEAGDGRGGAATTTVAIAVIEDSCANGVAVPSPDGNPGLVGDCEVLLAIRDTLVGDATLDWSAFTEIGDWDGVQVGGTPLRVTALWLWTRELSGSIPPELAQLGRLADLHLGGNSLTGAIPRELGELTGLRRLALYGNRLTGGIPTELGGLTALRQLQLGGNLLRGAIPTELGGLSSLELLSLHTNLLTGGIPAELGGLTALRVLYLHGNQLTGPVLAEIGQLSELRTIWLHGNQLTGEIPTELGGLTNLTGLSLHTNLLTGEIPTELGGLSNLERLSLSGNLLTGEIPTELGGLSNLERLSLSSNQLTGEIPWQLGGLSNLESLQLARNSLKGCVPSALRSVAENDLADLGLSDCAEDGPAPGPGDVSVSVTVDALSVGWSAVTGAAMYEVQYRAGGAGEWESVGTTTAALLTFSPAGGGPVCGTSYEVRVRSYGDAVTYAAGWGPASDAATATGLCMPMGLSAVLTATTTGNVIVISWTAPVGSSDPVDYRVDRWGRSKDGNLDLGWETLTVNTGSTDTSYTDTGDNDGTAVASFQLGLVDYSYRVRAVYGDGGLGPWSDEVLAVIP